MNPKPKVGTAASPNHKYIVDMGILKENLHRKVILNYVDEKGEHRMSGTLAHLIEPVCLIIDVRRIEIVGKFEAVTEMYTEEKGDVLLRNPVVIEKFLRNNGSYVVSTAEELMELRRRSFSEPQATERKAGTPGNVSETY